MAEASFRVALVIGDLGVGGAQKQAFFAATALHAFPGVDVRVFSTTPEVGAERFAQLRDAGIPVIPFGQRKNPIGRIADLAREFRRFRPHVALALRTYLSPHAGAAARLTGTTAIGTLRNSLAYEEEGLGVMMRPACVLPHAMAVNSYHARDALAATGWLAPERIHVLLNVIDVAEFDHQADAPLDLPPSTQRSLFFVGRFVAAKRIDRVLRVLQMALPRVPDLHLSLVGDGDLCPDIKAQVEQMGLAERVTFLGSRDDVPALLKQHAAALLLLSDEEGFANVLIEAMAARIPIITTPAGDSGVIVEDGITGYVADYDDLTTMADRVVRLMTDDTLRQQLGTQGRRRVETTYSYAKFALQVRTLFARFP